MRFKIAYFVIFGLGCISFITMISQSTFSEEMITGEWVESSWEYQGDEMMNDTVHHWRELQKLKDHLGQDFSIHESEIWTFLPDGTLKISGTNRDNDHNLKWLLKGRGNVLVLKESKDQQETYNIKKLDDDLMVLNFIVDIQARGVAKLTFEKRK